MLKESSKPATVHHHNHHTCEVGLHAQGMGGWANNDYHQIDKSSKFNGSISEVTIGNLISITHEIYDASSLEQIGRSSPGKLMFLHVQSSKPVFINGAQCDSSLIHFSSDMFIHAVSVAPVHSYIITIDKQLFLENSASLNHLARCGLPFEQFCKIDKHTLLEIKEIIDFLLLNSLQTNNIDAEFDTKTYQLLKILISIFDSGFCKQFYKDLFSNRSYIAQKSCLYINQNISNTIQIPDICTYLKVSRRTLQSAFQDTFGVSPNEYIKTVRLNRARRLLILGPTEKIHTIALDSGFNHFGRFSQYYHDFFGETPSESAQRLRNSKHH